MIGTNFGYGYCISELLTLIIFTLTDVCIHHVLWRYMCSVGLSVICGAFSWTTCIFVCKMMFSPCRICLLELFLWECSSSAGRTRSWVILEICELIMPSSCYSPWQCGPSWSPWLCPPWLCPPWVCPPWVCPPWLCPCLLWWSCPPWLWLRLPLKREWLWPWPKETGWKHEVLHNWS